MYRVLKTLVVSFLLGAAYVTAFPGAPNQVGPVGHTKNGSYLGVSVPQLSQEIFRGIPFAHAPRFERPQSLNESWAGTRLAVEPGLTCAGFGTNNQFGWPVGEDCLNMNIIRPAGCEAGEGLPVMVWIYGGGFRQGSNRDPEFNTSFMVQTSMEIGHPVIVVSINYRLAGFGFLWSQQINETGATNLGLRDQWKALDWIQENIRGFGGDPNQITIWGESAGAFSIDILISAYDGDIGNRFQRAILASGSWWLPTVTNPAAYQSLYDEITADTGCNDTANSLQCLKELPYDVLNATLAVTQSPAPIIDGDFLRTLPTEAFFHDPPLLAPVDMITGCNSDEAIGLGIQLPYNSSVLLAAAIESIAGVNSTIANIILDLYPIDAPSPPYSLPMSVDWIALTAAIGIASGTETRRAYAIFTDLYMMAGRRMTAKSWPKIFPNKKVYSYRWDTDPTTIPLVYTPGLGVGFAQHGAELSWEFRLPYVSGSPYPPLPKVPVMQKESYAMQAQWISFAATGNPNAHGLWWIPRWDPYGAGAAARNMVYNATLGDVLNLHIEDDDFRSDAIGWINDNWQVLQTYI